MGGGGGEGTNRVGFTVWLTGLSGSGKSTIATLVADRLRELGQPLELLDGDAVRTNLSSGLGFSKEDRDTNIRRIGWVCEVLNRHGVAAVVAAISPYRDARDEVRRTLSNFVEVHVDCSLETLVARDPKGLYQRAQAGQIAHFTGVSDPYEPPLHAEVTCRTDNGATPAQCADEVVSVLRGRGLVA